MSNIIGIYKITSPTGKIYIGQSWNIKERFRTYKRLKCKAQRKLYSSLAKYSTCLHIFSIEEEIKNCTQSELDSKENYYWKFYTDKGAEMLNLREGGS